MWGLVLTSWVVAPWVVGELTGAGTAGPPATWAPSPMIPSLPGLPAHELGPGWRPTAGARGGGVLLSVSRGPASPSAQASGAGPLAAALSLPLWL